MTDRCKSVNDFLPAGVRRSGKSGQIQLLNAVVKQIRSCVPASDRWRLFSVSKPKQNSTAGGRAIFSKRGEDENAWFLSVNWWTDDRESLAAFVNEKMMYSSSVEYIIICATTDLDVTMEITRKFPRQLIDVALLKK